MSMAVDVDIWVRGTLHATTHRLAAITTSPDRWTDGDIRRLLSEMLLALEREKNPGGEPPPVTLRGFSWIVSPFDAGGVLLHLDMQMGTASAGPFAIDPQRLTEMVARVMDAPATAERVH